MNNKLKTVDAETLLSTPMSKTMFIVDGLISQGVNVISGASKIGKSWLMLWLGLQVAQGNSIWGLPTLQCDVLYLSLEDTQRRIKDRLYNLTDSAPDNLYFAVTSGLIGGGLEEQITDFLTEHPATKLVIIDTLQKVRDSKGSAGKAGMYGNDYDDISSIKRIADGFNIAILLVHHLRKLQDSDDPFNDVSGSTGIIGAADTNFILRRKRSGNAAKPKVEEIPLTELTPFKNHPFKVKNDAEMAELMKSIADAGVLSPALARPKEGGGYELISGHQRLAACKALGMDTMPVIVRKLTDEEAVITMVDSNLQREHILPSEKAFAYKMKMEALKRKAGRPEKNSSQVATNFDTATEIGKSTGESRDQVFRYIRLTNLIPEILQMVDDGKIALTPAVELSYLQPSEQEALFSVMDCDEVTPSLSQAQRLRRMSENQTLTDTVAMQLMSEVKGNQVEYVRVPVDKLRSFFRPDTSMKQMTETLVKAMDFYNKHLERQHRDRDAR